MRPQHRGAETSPRIKQLCGELLRDGVRQPGLADLRAMMLDRHDADRLVAPRDEQAQAFVAGDVGDRVERPGNVDLPYRFRQSPDFTGARSGRAHHWLGRVLSGDLIGAPPGATVTRQPSDGANQLTSDQVKRYVLLPKNGAHEPPH